MMRLREGELHWLSLYLSLALTIMLFLITCAVFLLSSLPPTLL